MIGLLWDIYTHGYREFYRRQKEKERKALAEIYKPKLTASTIIFDEHAFDFDTKRSGEGVADDKRKSN